MTLSSLLFHYFSLGHPGWCEKKFPAKIGKSPGKKAKNVKKPQILSKMKTTKNRKNLVFVLSPCPGGGHFHCAFDRTGRGAVCWGWKKPPFITLSGETSSASPHNDQDLGGGSQASSGTPFQTIDFA